MMNIKAKKLIQQFELSAHPEGGYFKETLSSSELITPFNRETRPLYTSILFLLSELEVSHFHRLKSDEIWIFQKGDPLDVVVIDENLKLEVIHLGLEKDCIPQAVVKAGTIFGSYVPNGGTSLVACIVSPGFLYSEFELFSKETLMKMVPQYKNWIEKLGMN